MIKSDSIAKLAEALSKAQDEMGNASKESSNPFFGSKYADLASVREACKPLAKHGLAIVQIPETGEDGKPAVLSVLLHSSGEYIGGSLTMKPVKEDPQGVGSAITYARRYAYAGLAGIATEDDDGNAASGKVEGQQKTKVKIEKTQAQPQSPEPPPPLPKPNGSGLKGIAEGQRTNFKTVFEKALPKERKADAAGLYVDYLAENKINFDTMDPTDFFATRDEAERYAKSL